MSTEAQLELAQYAARLIVEEGLDYGQAKQKAAEALGRRRVRAADLPSNEEVEDEVIEHLRLFCADTQPAELQALRELALAWMDRLAPFRPHLGGAAWRGTATQLSNLIIDLYCDDPKAADIEFINLGLDADPGAVDGRHGDELPVRSTAARHPALPDPVTLHFIVHDLDDLRGALRPDARGRSWRGDAAALRRRMAEEGHN